MAINNLHLGQWGSAGDMPCIYKVTICSKDKLLVRKVEGINEWADLGLCVVKEFELSNEQSTFELQKREAMKEAKLLSQARHRHVIKLCGTYSIGPDESSDSGESPWYGIIMEEANSSLSTYLKGIVDVPKSWFGCLVDTLAHIHGLGIRHRDIKPENILVVRGGKKGIPIIKLSDFGISQAGLGRTTPTTIPALARGRSESFCAPEVQHGSTRGRAADVFSLGAVLLEILIATSCADERTKLARIINQEGSQHYAANVEMVQQWMEEELKGKLDADWQRQILSLC
ncbi:kinase-like domain-containing protein [Podospora didyma]|uniref:Kinase-like domain-containing protein n=1 Tax=Podospora didyma TaxID=330526 RepID=A0AAE0P8B7_9PEZI|nr:kinase-like domain-containing protein [Podospora didyma]